MEIVWDDLVDAFENSGEEMVYFLDRETGEIFTVPVYYDDPDFWEEVSGSRERYLQVPSVDPGQERFVVYDFIRKVEDRELRTMLEETFVGNRRFGRLEEILSFYPEEMERLRHVREALVADRIRSWLEENDIFPHQDVK
jgi:hypothetical protein